MENSIIVTPEHFLQHAIQPLWIWYDRFGDKSKKGQLPQASVKQTEKDELYKQTFLSALTGPRVDEADPEKAFAKTLQLMKEGAPYICNGCIQIAHKEVLYRGRPDILERRAGHCVFGDWYYAPIEIKPVAKVEHVHKSQLAFYALILSKMQGYFPVVAKIINGQGQPVLVSLGEKGILKTREITKKIIDILRGQKPEVNIATKSKRSPWFDLEFQEAQEKKDISLIYNLNERGIAGLRNVGINTLEDLVNCDVSALPKIPYATPLRIKRAWLQAKAILDNTVITMIKPQMPTALFTLYCTIIAQESAVYLIGIRVTGDVKQQYAKGCKKNIRMHDAQDGSYFIYFMANKLENEVKMWFEFISWVNNLPNEYVVYHYSHAPKIYLKKLAEKYDNTDDLKSFQDSLVSIKKTLEDSLALPLYFYSLKDVATSEFINFSWRQEKTDGDHWYKQWLETQDKKLLARILDHSEDTACAMQKVFLFMCKKLEIQ